tara:strand:- start:767 stop:955 length:189 start_codon:yes stop_codon:yes gene_type:complete
MKFITLIFALLLTNQAFAHAGHGFDDNLMHFVFHAIFWTLLAGLVYKVIRHFKAKKDVKKHS